MRIDIVTALPGLLESPLGDSIVKRAIEKGLVEINIHDLRDYSKSTSRQIDDYAYGGGAGMVLMPEPLIDCIETLGSEHEYDEIIFMTPDGKTLKQTDVNRLSLLRNVMIIAGHYKGIDERVREHFVTSEVSIGDFVLSGGELPAAVLTDAIVRLIPGVLNDETSALSDSFQDGLLAPPVYTRPADYKGMKVPEILLSGNEKAIQEWRFEQALTRTKNRRPDLLDSKE